MPNYAQGWPPDWTAVANCFQRGYERKTAALANAGRELDEARKAAFANARQALDRSDQRDAAESRASKAEAALRDVRPTLDDINGLLGGEGDPEGECVARTAGLLRDRIDLALSDAQGTAPTAPFPASEAAPPAPDLLRENARLREEVKAAVAEIKRQGARIDTLTAEGHDLACKLVRARAALSGAAPRPPTDSEALRELRQQVEDTIMVAQTDEDAEGWITAYHFKTGAIHRLLAKARDITPDAALADRTGDAAQPPSDAAAAAPAKEGK